MKLIDKKSDWMRDTNWDINKKNIQWNKKNNKQNNAIEKRETESLVKIGVPHFG